MNNEAQTPETVTPTPEATDSPTPAPNPAVVDTPDLDATPASTPAPDAAADLPTMEELDAVASEIETVEEALARLDKKNAPMCDACQTAFADAPVAERLALLSCSH